MSTFQPCRQGQHEACTVAYWTTDADGRQDRAQCACVCHRQASLFAPTRKTVIGDLFAKETRND